MNWLMEFITKCVFNKVFIIICKGVDFVLQIHTSSQ